MRGGGKGEKKIDAEGGSQTREEKRKRNENCQFRFPKCYRKNK